jgi:hypothetical protein
LRPSYTQWNLQGLEVSEVEWSWWRRQEVTGVATEEAAGRREGYAQRRRECSVSAKLGGGNMSGLPSDSLRSGGLICPYFPHCEAQHGVLQCVRLAHMAKEQREAIEIARKVCLHCREQGVEADGTCGRCGSPPYNCVRAEAVGGAMVETRVDCGPKGQ